MLTSVILGMGSAVAGGILGSVLYQKDVEANKYNEKFVPFASMQNLTNKFKSAKKADNSFKEVVNGKDNPEPFTPEELKAASYDKEVQEAKAEVEAAEEAVATAETSKVVKYEEVVATAEAAKSENVATEEVTTVEATTEAAKVEESKNSEPEKVPEKKTQKQQQQKNQKADKQQKSAKPTAVVVEAKQEDNILPKFTHADN